MPARINNAGVSAVRQTTATDASRGSAALNQKATDWIKANSGEGWGTFKLPAIDSGNLGMSAFVPTAAQAKSLLQAGKAFSPGIPEMRDAKLDPAKERLVVAMTSDDEPALHLCIQNKKTGEMKYLGDFNTNDLSTDTSDWTGAMNRMSKGAQWLQLGEGSAGPNWWN